jgi:predicted RNA-binding protein with TRAM domain
MAMPWERRGRGESREGGFGGGRGGRGGFGGGRPRFRREESDEPKPVKVGEVHTVTISEVSRRGDGIARIKNFVVFVAGTQKGDTVKVKITEVRGNHATGEVVGEGEASEAEETETTDEVVESSEGPKNNGEEEGTGGEPEAKEEESEEEGEEEEFA